MPRAIWSGAISFGLVNVPVRMYTAIAEHKLQFRYIHQNDGSPIGYSKVCKAEDRPVPDEEIVKAYEWTKDEFVPMRDEDFATAQASAGKAIEIEDFVSYEEIDPIFFERTYYLGPQENAEGVYALLVTAMERSGRAAIGRYVMRDRQHLGCLRVREGVLVLEKMHFADEIRPADEVKPEPREMDKRELELAGELIDRLTGAFEPEKYRDAYRDALMKIVEAKREGEVIAAPAPRERPETPDLMAALKASLEPAGEPARAGDGRPAGRKRPSLDRLSKKELYERARKRGVPGRSEMSREELVEALSR